MSLDDGPADGSPEILPALEDRQPGFHLLATGCVGQTRADTGSVVLGVPGEASLLFDCTATTREAWEEAYRREMQDRIARILPEGSIIALTGYWQYEVTMITTTCTEFVGSVEVVYSEDQSTAVYTPDGQYVGVFSFVGGVPQRFDFYSSYPCTEMVVSEGTWVEFDPGEGGGGGSGGGGGGGTLPPPPPPPADTCPHAGDALGPLQNRFIQDSLGAALGSAIALDHELAGWIARHPDTGQWFFVRGTMDMSATDNCNYRLNPQSLPGEFVAFWHTHLYPDGAQVFCRLRNTTITVNNAASGGRSFSSQGFIGDWDAVRDPENGGPMYTIDPNTIYRLDPGTAPGSEGDKSEPMGPGAGVLRHQVKWESQCPIFL